MSLPVCLLITGMAFPPFPPAVTDDLGVLGVGGHPAAMIFGASPPLTLRLVADVLLGMELGRFERLLAKVAAARQNISSEDRLGTILRKSKYRNSYRVLYCLPARGLSGRRLSAAGGLLYLVHQSSAALAPWCPPIPPKMAPFLRAP